MATEKRLIDAMQTVTKLSKRILPLIQLCVAPKLIYNEVLQVIAEQPTVDAAPVVHAHWEEWWPGDCALIMTGEEMLYRCSACDAKYPDVEGFKFCPHCAAKMDLEELCIRTINAKRLHLVSNPKSVSLPSKG